MVQIANEIVAKIQDRQREGKFCTIAIGATGCCVTVHRTDSETPKDEGVSFRNVVFFNLWRILSADRRCWKQFQPPEQAFSFQIDIDRQNIFTPDGSIPSKEASSSTAVWYEQRIQTFEVLIWLSWESDVKGNIGMNEPGSHASSTTRLILIDATSRSEASHIISVGQSSPAPIRVSIPLAGSQKSLYAGQGEDKADIIRSAVEDKVSDTLPGIDLQTSCQHFCLRRLGCGSPTHVFSVHGW